MRVAVFAVPEHNLLYALFDTLENSASTDERFLWFTNEIEKLLLLEAPTHIVNEGRKEVLDDMNKYSYPKNTDNKLVR